MYNKEQVTQAATEYFNGNKLQADVWVGKYSLKDPFGGENKYHELTPEDMHRRLAKAFASVEQNDKEKWEQIFYSYMKNFSKIVPQGSPMSVIGNDFVAGSASNCVVVASPEDSMTGIMYTAMELAELYKRRCGVGVDLSTLRPDGSPVDNQALTSSGAWSFADLYSCVTRIVGQSNRRGALMLTLDVTHPDIRKFVTMKHDLTKVTGANVSVKLTDDFMDAVVNDVKIDLVWSGKVFETIRAKEIWDLIISSATKTAEPGLLMWDNYCDNLPAHNYQGFTTVSTNPCAELGLSSYDSCRLISIYLAGFVKNMFSSDAYFDYDDFSETVKIATRMSDNLVSLELQRIDCIIQQIKNKYRSNSKIHQLEVELWEKLRNTCEKGRRTGLGTHGLADTMARCCVRYDSSKGIKMVRKIYQALRDVNYRTQIELAKERGAFPIWDYQVEKDNAFIKRWLSDNQDVIEDYRKYGRRNISALTNAPTGTCSLMSDNCSSGIEPVFRNAYTRRVKLSHDQQNIQEDYTDQVGDRWKEYKVYHSNVQKYLDLMNIESINHEDLPEYFVTSDKIDWQKRVEIQAAIQQFIDHSISSTINLPKGTSEEVVGNIYIEAWKQGLKGVTVYVDGSRSGVLITEESGRPSTIKHRDAPKRPKTLQCDIYKATSKGNKYLLAVGLLDSLPYEIFCFEITNDLEDLSKHKHGTVEKIAKGNYLIKANGDQIKTKNLNTDIERFAMRAISAKLRHGIEPQFIVDTLKKSSSGEDESFDCFTKVVSRILKKYIKDGEIIRTSEKCPSCNALKSLVYEEGCKKCRSCGFSGCD